MDKAFYSISVWGRKGSYVILLVITGFSTICSLCSRHNSSCPQYTEHKLAVLEEKITFW